MAVATEAPVSEVILHLPLTDDQFAELCTNNPDLRFEYTCTGDLIIMPPTSSDTGERNASLTADFVIWNRSTGAGRVFDSSMGFILPNGAKRSPDVSWISHERWDALSDRERQGLARICPDFVLELRSPTDRLGSLQEKMQEYLDNGARLGWLIDPTDRVVYVYCPGKEMERFDAPIEISGEPVLPGFGLRLATAWPT
ncbi:Uma2 family endonuclease [Candidatus Entotheonella palauensis]|uniref:Uma2 family endonuclease n=1 Tax=Candidatus Entotheonella palauensis TaxID=93172 RepID=UPI000B7E553E|nr:Uma2 family endonuclease [Candidatus Entotheonella palauensis]